MAGYRLLYLLPDPAVAIHLGIQRLLHVRSSYDLTPRFRCPKVRFPQQIGNRLHVGRQFGGILGDAGAVLDDPGDRPLVEVAQLLFARQ